MLLFYLSLIEAPEARSKFEQLYHQYGRLMKYTAYNILNDEDLAEDAVHDAFLGIINHLKTIDDIHSPRTKAYILATIRHASLDLAKKECKQRHADVFDEDMFASNTNIEGILEAKAVAERIQLLPDKHRIVIELKL